MARDAALALHDILFALCDIPLSAHGTSFVPNGTSFTVRGLAYCSIKLVLVNLLAPDRLSAYFHFNRHAAVKQIRMAQGVRRQRYSTCSTSSRSLSLYSTNLCPMTCIISDSVASASM